METVAIKGEVKREYGRKIYAEYKADHRCVRCGKVDKRTLEGFTCCEPCAKRQREYDTAHRLEHNDRRAQKKRQQRIEWMAQNRCTSCGAALPDGDLHLTCVKCRAKRAKPTEHPRGPYLMKPLSGDAMRRRSCDLIKGLSEAEKLQVCLSCPYAECVEGGD